MIGLHNGNPKLPGLVQWYGGKGNMLAKLIPLIPWSQVYCEPFGGSASLLLNLKPRPVEVYNDLDGNLVNLARVLQNPEMAEQLAYRLEHTLYAREEFREALRILNDPQAEKIVRAWAFFVAKNQGFSGKSNTEGDWGRVFVSHRKQAKTVAIWRNRVARLHEYMARLVRVQIDSVDAVDCIRFWDQPETCFYLDPPYVHDTRTKGHLNEYAQEMSLEDHDKLTETLLDIKGMAILSCYFHAVYAPLLSADWQRMDYKTTIHAANSRGKGSKPERIETILMNPAAWRHYDRQLSLAISLPP